MLVYKAKNRLSIRQKWTVKSNKTNNFKERRPIYLGIFTLKTRLSLSAILLIVFVKKSIKPYKFLRLQGLCGHKQHRECLVSVKWPSVDPDVLPAKKTRYNFFNFLTNVINSFNLLL